MMRASGRFVAVAAWVGGLAAAACAQAAPDQRVQRGGETGARVETNVRVSGGSAAGGRPSGASPYGPARQSAAPAVTYGDIQVSSFGTRVLPSAPGNSGMRHRDRGDDAGLGVIYVTGLPAPVLLSEPAVASIPDDNGVSEPTQYSSSAQSAYAEGRYAAAAPVPIDVPQDSSGTVAPIERRVAPQTSARNDAAPAQVAAPPAREVPLEDAEAVTLVFKDGRPSEKVRNYLLTRTTLYITDKRRREIPVEALDVPATEEANREAGLSFHLTASAK